MPEPALLLAASSVSARAMPPENAYSIPVPAHAIHPRNPRRSIPSVFIIVFHCPPIHTRLVAQIFPGIYRPLHGYCVVVVQADTLVRFEQAVMPHLNAAYNLARWLMRNQHDAEDAVQDAYLRAFRFFDSFDGEDSRAWLLAIVRNRCRTALEQTSRRASTAESTKESMPSISALRIRTAALRKAEIQSLHACIDDLPTEYREVIVLRELEQLSYKEVAVVAAVPVGTVMSRFSRARVRLQECIASRVKREVRQ